MVLQGLCNIIVKTEQQSSLLLTNVLNSNQGTNKEDGVVQKVRHSSHSSHARELKSLQAMSY